MDEHRTKPEDRRTGGSPRALRRQREKIQETVSSRGKQLDDLEARLAKEMTRLSFEARQAAEDQTPAQVAALAEVLEPHAGELGRLRDELKQLHNSFADTQQEVLTRQRALAEQF